MADFDRDTILPALFAEWDVLLELLDGIEADAWFTPTALPGWTVHDITAHLVGTESMLAGIATPRVDVDVAALPHVHNPIGEFNEQWVEALRELPGSEMVVRLAEVTRRRRESLTAMSDDDLHAPADTPAGRASYLRFMRIRVFDCWVHELDIRDAIGVPGDESGPRAEVAFDEMIPALGFVVGKKAKAPDGTHARFSLGGPMAREISVEVRDGRGAVSAAAESESEPEPTVGLALDSRLFTRLATGRTHAFDHPGEITVTGDADLGRAIANSLAFTM
ncbi:maleylpyruvate isomerase family mycothiol-dependent enzyme [Rhodococcus rhodnii]|uniref:Mycothiol-dependent maleylpyruvate isomerase metal-binding domain-containing protein n=2 Tax=Rhodococcus rhodnii TaxID=38312 RepID=R7WI85_9NOCA|nr:maleylpyruvate isomerase family mycothiol-dependent enzyme [Rhodococcus rhodnii]EOM74880.1 hypothetical protein Rrhod_3757 [Rhodococcus rhodnii LMG 5362]TXG91671.1 maleylpyruvate isomerase family mycothiol-dependent enzyme [Rhodococcus rhodnii]